MRLRKTITSLMIFGSARLDVNAGEGNSLHKNLKIVKCIQKKHQEGRYYCFAVGNVDRAFVVMSSVTLNSPIN